MKIFSEVIVTSKCYSLATIEKQAMCVCVCVFVCVCVCVYVWVGVFILFFLLVSSDCKTSLTYLRCSDQRSFVVSISRGFCQVPSSLFLNLSCFISKDENSSPQLRRLLLSKFFHIESSPWH